MDTTILAIETCSETCTVALSHDGQLEQLLSDVPRGHGENVLPMIETLLNNAQLPLVDITAIAFTRGPGAFTGVRIGTSVAQGLSVATGIPLLSVSSLAVLAQGSYRETGNKRCLAALDARMSEVYFGIYQLNEHNLMVSEENEQVASAENLSCENEQEYVDQYNVWQSYGPGWNNYLDAMNQRFSRWNVESTDKIHFPQAIDLIPLALHEYHSGRLLDAAEALPVYVRDQVVKQ